MKAWHWILIVSVGFAMMLWAYGWRELRVYMGPWRSGLMILSSEAPAEAVVPAGVIRARLRLLSSNEVAELLLFGTGDAAPAKALGVKGQVRVKLIELALPTAEIVEGRLQSGRLPEPGTNEVLAGARIGPRETLIVGGETLRVVGVLKPGLALFADSFLVSPGANTDKLFPAAVPTVVNVWLVSASAEELSTNGVRKPLEEAFPPEKYAWVTTPDRLDPHAFRLYLAGLATFLLGGSGALIALFRWLAGKFTSPVLSGPLLEMKARPRLVWGVHLVYFGIVMAGALLMYKAPEAQVVLLSKIREALANKSSLLAIVGEPYLSGNIPLAAVVTFAISFLLGSLACITIPSIVLPGAGMLVASLLGMTSGLLLAPVTQNLAVAMLPLWLMMLLAGEGFILATLFGLLIPIHVVRRSLGGNMITRFGRVILLNLKAQVWIALVLGAAAIYGATAVILMNP
jgi:hypothetical protein